MKSIPSSRGTDIKGNRGLWVRHLFANVTNVIDFISPAAAEAKHLKRFKFGIGSYLRNNKTLLTNKLLHDDFNHSITAVNVTLTTTHFRVSFQNKSLWYVDANSRKLIMRISLITVKLLPAVTLTLLNSSLHELLYISQENILPFTLHLFINYSLLRLRFYRGLSQKAYKIRITTDLTYKCRIKFTFYLIIWGSRK